MIIFEEFKTLSKVFAWISLYYAAQNLAFLVAKDTMYIKALNV